MLNLSIKDFHPVVGENFIKIFGNTQETPSEELKALHSFSKRLEKKKQAFKAGLQKRQRIQRKNMIHISGHPDIQSKYKLQYDNIENLSIKDSIVCENMVKIVENTQQPTCENLKALRRFSKHLEKKKFKKGLRKRQTHSAKEDVPYQWTPRNLKYV